MPGVLNKIAELTDEQLAEGTSSLANARTDDLRFYHAAMLMEQDRRRGRGSKGDRPGHPFRGNQWTGGGVGGSAGSSSLGLSAALDAMTGRQPPNAATSVRKIDQSSVKSDEPLKHGGVNESRVVEIEGEGKFCFKPDAGEYPGVHPAYRGHQSVNEVAASVVDEAMGLDMVAKTEMVEIGGKKGSLQRWVNDDASVAKELIEYDGEDIKDSSKLDSAEGVSDMMYYDALIGNTDRHYGNWLVKDGRVQLIDNGMSMADNLEYGDPALKYRSLEHQTGAKRGFQKMSPKFKEGLGKLLNNKADTDAKLKAAGVGATQRESFWRRAEYMQKAGMLGFGDSTLRDLGRLAEGRRLFASVVEMEVKGDLPGHPFRGNQWSGGGGTVSRWIDTPKSDISLEGEKAVSKYEVAGRIFTAQSDRTSRVLAGLVVHDDTTVGYSFQFEDDQGSTEVSGRGNAMAVMRRSVQEMVNHVKKLDPVFMHLSAKEPSRRKLYEFIAARSGDLFPGYVGVRSTKYPGQYALVKKGVRLDANTEVLSGEGSRKSEDFMDGVFWDELLRSLKEWKSDKDE